MTGIPHRIEEIRSRVGAVSSATSGAQSFAEVLQAQQRPITPPGPQVPAAPVTGTTPAGGVAPTTFSTLARPGFLGAVTPPVAHGAHGTTGLPGAFGSTPPSIPLPHAAAAPGAAPALQFHPAATGQIGAVTGAAPYQAGPAHGHAHGPTHTHAHGPIALDRVGPPPDLEPYGNGRIPPEALQPLGIGEHRLWAPAAQAFRAMAAHAASEGITIGVTSSYRTYDKQVELADRLGLYSQGGLAASPGTSNHGWGVALDLDLDDAAQAWMRENAPQYGFVEDVPREPWHWTFRGSGPPLV